MSIAWRIQSLIVVIGVVIVAIGMAVALSAVSLSLTLVSWLALSEGFVFATKRL